jgi:hypothetical protein
MVTSMNGTIAPARSSVIAIFVGPLGTPAVVSAGPPCGRVAIANAQSGLCLARLEEAATTMHR